MLLRLLPYRLVLLLVFAVLVGGCSTAQTVRTDDPRSEALREVNRAARGRIAKLSLRDGREVTAINLYIMPDSASWYDRGEERTRTVATSSVERVKVMRTGRAALVGLGAGVAAGAVFGGARAFYEGDDDPVTEGNLAISGRRKLLVYPFAHSAYAVLASTPFGAIVGSHDVFHLESPRGSALVTCQGSGC